MKLDHDLIRKILEKIETDANGAQPISIKDGSLDGNFRQHEIDYHLQILADDQLIVAKTLKGEGRIIDIMILRLSAEGHRVLEAMRNDGVWSKIKDTARMLGVEGLKQIPALAIKLLLGQ